MFKTETGEYMGNKTLTIKNATTDKRVITLGLGKAKALLANLEEIKKFVAENDKNKVDSSVEDDI